MKDGTILILCGMLCITLLECVALLLGHNGQLLMSVIGVLALCAGISSPRPGFIRRLTE